MVEDCTDAPPDCGLLVSLDGAGTCWMQFVTDAGLETVHPNIHQPSTIENTVELGGGGSGVTIVRGVDPQFGDVVLKHGGYKDTLELFALATIEEQLKLRGRSPEAQEASAEMSRQTPDFQFLYISQQHLGDRGAELWNLVKNKMHAAHLALHAVSGAGKPHADITTLHQAVSAVWEPSQASIPMLGIRVCGPSHRAGAEVSQPAAPVRLTESRLEVKLGCDAAFDEHRRVRASEPGKGYAYLQGFVPCLVAIERARSWKFTLAQRTIGGPNPMTGFSLLTRGKLKGGTLRTLIDGFIRVMRNLQILTLPDESSGLHRVREEVTALVGCGDLGPADISDAADLFVGLAVKKNFHPITGRFRKLREAGEAFRSGGLVLMEAEVLPAERLGMLLQAGARMEEVYETELTGPTALDTHFDVWRALLEHAVSLQGEAATCRVWTAGLTDAGLHNLFLGEDRLWFFDMGEPAVMPLPAFLTKLLMSFFHTLGMEEASTGGWVRRFEQGRGLRLTAATAEKLPQVRDAFRTTLGSLVQEVFDGEAAVRELLMRYVVLQLLSDAAFCLDRWATKGGGSHRLRPQAQNLEKWLWRALWDVYAATDLTR